MSIFFLCTVIHFGQVQKNVNVKTYLKLIYLKSLLQLPQPHYHPPSFLDKFHTNTHPAHHSVHPPVFRVEPIKFSEDLTDQSTKNSEFLTFSIIEQLMIVKHFQFDGEGGGHITPIPTILPTPILQFVQ